MVCRKQNVRHGPADFFKKGKDDMLQVNIYGHNDKPDLCAFETVEDGLLLKNRDKRHIRFVEDGVLILNRNNPKKPKKEKKPKKLNKRERDAAKRAKWAPVCASMWKQKFRLCEIVKITGLPRATVRVYIRETPGCDDCK